MNHPVRAMICAAASAFLLFFAQTANAEDPPAKGKPFVIGGEYQLTPPEKWVAKQPRSRIVEQEYAVPTADGDEIEGRVTVMGAGGSVEANLDRWYQQFTQPDGSSTKDRAKTDKKQVAGENVTIIDIAGTYMDRPAPMAPGVERENYRMLGAIVQTKKGGNVYIKFYGPQKTVAENAAAFTKMIDSLEHK